MYSMFESNKRNAHIAQVMLSSNEIAFIGKTPDKISHQLLSADVCIVLRKFEYSTSTFILLKKY